MSTEAHGSASGGTGGRRPIDSLAMRVFIMRHELDLSQRDAADRAGITFGEWQGIEDGRAARQLDVKIAKMALAFGYDRDWLMWGGSLDPGQADGGGGGMSSGGDTHRNLRPVRPGDASSVPFAPRVTDLDEAA